MARSATLFFVLALLALVGTLSASGKEGFSALTATDGLYVFDGLDALKTFKPSRILSLPLGGESAVAASANRAGDFVVISNHATVSLNSSGQFEPTHTVSDTYSFSDLGFFNSSSVRPSPPTPHQPNSFATLKKIGFSSISFNSLSDWNFEIRFFCCFSLFSMTTTENYGHLANRS